MRNPLTGAFAKYFMEATITEADLVTPTMRRIRLETGEPIPFPYSPGQHVRIQVNDPLSPRGLLKPLETLRTYTIREHEPQAFELLAHLYESDGGGIGLRWASQARPGDRVTFWRHQSGFFLHEEADYHLFVGEETASAAFGPMIGALNGSARVFGVLESESPEDDIPMPRPLELRRVHRHGAPAHYSKTLLAGVTELALPDEPGTAYVAGEARTCQMIRDHLVRDRGWPRASVRVKPFWTPGKRGLH
ncbi:siderophore-interacting protein [Actinomadura graeca]|uniref:Siderophore-interacting protein n=1 Tax=Actinomadura graeca TaxID=2750812 RepID=A0ABX8QSN6_9ACTN|nr:siderophore-interacting protein [Actinomadura graeca]QXJ21824.1 siderophore-interacting protein [Actinomadura graeca]